MQRIKELYQDANLGATIDLYFEVIATAINLRLVAKKDESWSSENLNTNVSFQS